MLNETQYRIARMIAEDNSKACFIDKLISSKNNLLSTLGWFFITVIFGLCLMVCLHIMKIETTGIRFIIYKLLGFIGVGYAGFNLLLLVIGNKRAGRVFNAMAFVLIIGVIVLLGNWYCS